MRVLIAADIFPPDIGGPATRAQLLRDELPKRDVVVDVVCYSDAPGDGVIRVVRGSSALSRYIRYTLALWRIAAAADVMYAMGPVAAGLPAAIVAFARRKPLVVQVVGDYAWEQAQNAGATTQTLDEFQRTAVSGKYKLLRMIQRFVCRRAQQVVVPSRYLLRIVSGWGISADCISVMYNAVTPVTLEDRDVLRKKLALDGVVIVSVGRLVPWKHHDQLISAVVALRQEISNLRCVIIGDGPLRDQLAGQIVSLGADEYITLFGRADHNTTQRWMRAADIFALVSSYEGLPFVAVEAAQQEIPIIATDVGGTSEVVVEGINGTLIPANDSAALQSAIRRLATDGVYRQQLTRGLDKQFQLDTMLTQTITTLQSVCAS